ncbi:MAG: hypothetical protein ABR915_15395 [Thermoguttaceae bacterium]|jgi:hypothetical protein
MTETLQEFCDCRGLSIGADRTAGVIRGVKILGLESRNGRTYLPEALAQAASLYENAKVNVNHPKPSPGAPRDYQDRIGVIRNVTPQGDGLFADFHFNPKHGLAEQLLWDAEHAPENVGFSHNVEARTARRGDRVVVEAITRVQSVDLVADPATTRGLFESSAAPAAAAADRPQPADGPLLETLRQQHAAEVRRLEAEVQRLSLLEAAHQKHDIVRRILREFQFPEPDASDPLGRAVTSRRFVESLLAAPDEAAMRALVEERAALVRALGAGGLPSCGGKPVSRDQYLVDGPARLDAKAFAEAIT